MQDSQLATHCTRNRTLRWTVGWAIIQFIRLLSYPSDIDKRAGQPDPVLPDPALAGTRLIGPDGRPSDLYPYGRINHNSPGQLNNSYSATAGGFLYDNAHAVSAVAAAANGYVYGTPNEVLTLGRLFYC